MILKFLRILTLAGAGIALSGGFLAGCASKEAAPVGAGTAEQLYVAAKRALNQGDFLTAIATFETLGARYPFGSFTQQAQLDVAYAYLRQDEFDSAINAADRFIKLYPRSETIDYAYYIKGVSHFSRGGSAMERIFPRDMAKVNQMWLSSAFAEFDTLVRRFPDSQYAPDALERMAYLRNEMARHELITASFYFILMAPPMFQTHWPYWQRPTAYWGRKIVRQIRYAYCRQPCRSTLLYRDSPNRMV